MDKITVYKETKENWYPSLSLQRYGQYWDDFMDSWDIQLDNEGSYVLYEDAMEEINKLKKQLELLRLAIR